MPHSDHGNEKRAPAMTSVTCRDPFHRFFAVGHRRNGLTKGYTTPPKINSRDHKDLFPSAR